MALKSLGPAPKFRAFDSDGNPLSGGKLYTYASGTTTPQATFTDATGAVANANPVILDANGEADVWYSPLNYKLVLKDANDVIQWTKDKFSGSPFPVTDEWLTYVHTWTFIDGTHVSVPGDQTALYPVNKAIRAVCTSGTYYGTITGVAFSGGVTTLTVAFSDGAFDAGVAGASKVSVGVLSTDSPGATNAAAAAASQSAAASSAAAAATSASNASASASASATSASQSAASAALFATATQSSLIGHVAAGTGAVTTTVQAKLRELPSVIDFGADPTGVADSTAAFNAMTARLRALIVDVSDYDYVGYSLTIPPGTYSVSSWDLTSLFVHNVHVNGHGATLVARTAGKHVIDAIGSRYIKFHGLTIYSTSAAAAKSGIQIGPKETEACGNQSFNDVTILGYYASAALMNLGSETTSHHNLRLLQNNTSAGAYALIADGLSTYLPTSDYATVTRASGVAVSFTANSFAGCQIRNEGGGSAAYLAKTQGFAFDMGTYWLSFNDSAVVVYGTSTYRSEKLTLRGSFETNLPNLPTAGNTGMKYAVTFANDGTNTAISGFNFESSNMYAVTSVFRVTGGGSYRLSDADIRVHDITGSAPIFGTGSMSVDGILMTQSAAQCNLGTLTAFNGLANVDTYAGIASLPVAGGYTIHARSDNVVHHGGGHDFTAYTFTPTVTFATPGDLSVSYTTQSGFGYKVGKLRFFQIAVAFTPTHTTASGEFRIGGLPDVAASGTSRDSVAPVVYINSAWTWPASATNVSGLLPTGSGTLRIYGHGSGIASTAFTAANVPSGTAKSITLSGSYVTA